MYKNHLKRALDFCLAFSAVIILSPLLILVAILVKATSKGPVMYKQTRLGKSGREFEVYKFRSMTDKERVLTQVYGSDNPEITTVGKYIRRFKVDELPQLFNILNGDMSIVGPRPALPKQKDEFDNNGRRRLDVRPGLTGLAQVNGNIYLSWQERWKYDKAYVDKLSFILDLKIVIKTIAIVIFGEEKFIKKHNA